MADVIYEIKNSLRDKVNSKDTQSIESDKEYYFAVGQFVSFYYQKVNQKIFHII